MLLKIAQLPLLDDNIPVSNEGAIPSTKFVHLSSSLAYPEQEDSGKIQMRI